MQVETIKIASLYRHPRFRCRALPVEVLAEELPALREAFEDAGPGWGDVDPILVGRLSEGYSSKADPSPFTAVLANAITVRKGTLVLIGGYTRVHIAESLGIEWAEAIVRDVTWAQALELAWGENARHGTRRGEQDTQLVLDQIHAIPALAAKPEREVAKLASCSRTTVNRYRQTLKAIKDAANAPAGGRIPSPAPTKPTSTQSTFGGPALYRDTWGREVPEALNESFRCVQPARSMADRIRKCAYDLRSLKYGSENSTVVREVGLSRVDVLEIAGELCAHADGIDANLPFLVCPQCEGDGDNRAGCKLCKGLGYLLRAATDELPADLERKARDQMRAA